jgi:endonuclease YncB( thermonuclease family)
MKPTILLCLLFPLCAFKVYDGDTITGVKYRLAYIDAPELRQTCKVNGIEKPIGEQSRDYLESIFTQDTGDCLLVDTDRYGRIVIDCKVNFQMVKAGMAVCYDKYIKDLSIKSTCHKVEQYAIDNKLGVWACSDFTLPSEWRKNR